MKQKSLLQKAGILMLLLLIFSLARSQTPDSVCVKRMTEASQYLKGVEKLYNPEKAFTLYWQCALAGNADAMNIVGGMYAQGKGVDADMVQARQWFEKAALLGSGQAWYNLGMIYKYAQGVEQDFKEAYNCFQKSAEKDYLPGMYAAGFMLYKGLGCKQSYLLALTYFMPAAILGDVSSMYMRGLCFRNGYGVKRDTVEAEKWLDKAASKGYKFAKEEVRELHSENYKDSTIIQFVQLLPKLTIFDSVYNSPKKDKPLINKIDGEYTGQIVTFDWSSFYSLDKSPLVLTLKTDGKNVNGTWIEGNKPASHINAQLTDSTLVFDNSCILQKDHYSSNGSQLLKFANSSIYLRRSDTTVYLSGVLQTYIPELMEPGKPRYLLLTRKNNSLNSNENQTPTKTLNSDTTINALMCLQVFPNPITSNFTLSFKLNSEQNIRIGIYDANMGGQVYNSNLGIIQAGVYSQSISFTGHTGIYVVRVFYGQYSKSITIGKQ